MILEQIAFIFGMGFVTLICICIVYSLIGLFVQDSSRSAKGNKKLLDNMDKMKDEKWN